jgi:hypothetical protein
LHWVDLPALSQPSNTISAPLRECIPNIVPQAVVPQDESVTLKVPNTKHNFKDFRQEYCGPPLTAYLIPGESVIEHTLLRNVFSGWKQYATRLPASRNLNACAVVWILIDVFTVTVVQNSVSNFFTSKTHLFKPFNLHSVIIIITQITF